MHSVHVDATLQSSSRSQTWTTDYFDRRRTAPRRGWQGSPDFSDLTLVLQDDDQGVSSHQAEIYGYFFQHEGKRCLKAMILGDRTYKWMVRRQEKWTMTEVGKS